MLINIKRDLLFVIIEKLAAQFVRHGIKVYSMTVVFRYMCQMSAKIKSIGHEERRIILQPNVPERQDESRKIKLPFEQPIWKKKTIL